MIEGTKENFEQEVLKMSGVALVYFWATWCGPCKVMSPAIEKFAKNNSSLKVVKINADENQDLTQRYSIMSIPTMLLFKNGTVMKQIIGAQSAEQIENFVKS